MATNVIMPALGVSQDSGKILHWFKDEGQSVTEGEPLLEIETDKATAELESPASGILANVTAREGDEVPVAQVIALILAPGESAPPPSSGIEQVSAPVAVVSEAAAPIASTPAGTGAAPEHGPRTATPADRVGASPKARQLAAARGIDLASLEGSGPDGVVQAADVLAAPIPPPPMLHLQRQRRRRSARCGASWRSGSRTVGRLRRTSICCARSTPAV